MYTIIVMNLQCYWSDYRTPLENSCVTNNTAEYIGLPFSSFYAYGYIVCAIIFMQCEVLTENELKSNQVKPITGEKLTFIALARTHNVRVSKDIIRNIMAGNNVTIARRAYVVRTYNSPRAQRTMHARGGGGGHSVWLENHMGVPKIPGRGVFFVHTLRDPRGTNWHVVFRQDGN